MKCKLGSLPHERSVFENKSSTQESSAKKWRGWFSWWVQLYLQVWSTTCLFKLLLAFQLLSHVWLLAIPWMTACQAPLSSTISWCLIKFISIELVILPNHLTLCCPFLLLPTVFPSIRVFFNESALHIRWPNIGASTLASVLPMNIQGWYPLGWTGWISLQSKGFSRLFSNTTVQKHQFFGAQLSL